MPSASAWSTAADILAGGGLEATARSYLGSTSGETVRQVVFSRYPQLALGAKNYLVGLVNSFLAAGEIQQNSLLGTTIQPGDIPVNPGLGGVAGAVDRYRYSTYVNAADPSGSVSSSIPVDVVSPVELTSAAIAADAESTIGSWGVKYPRLAAWLQEHPVPTGVTIVGVQRAW